MFPISRCMHTPSLSCGQLDYSPHTRLLCPWNYQNGLPLPTPRDLNWTELNSSQITELFPSQKNAKIFLTHKHIFSFNVFFKIICLHQVLVPTSDQFSRSVMSDSLWPREPQHARPPCPSPTPGVHTMHVHWDGDAIQLSHPLSSPSPPALNLSQHQGLFRWVSSPHQMAKVLEFQLQHQSFQWTPRTDLL